MAGLYQEEMGQNAYEELAERLGIEGDSDELIAVLKAKQDTVGI